MKEVLSEEEMRRALFGPGGKQSESTLASDTAIKADQQHVSKARKATTSLSPKLRVVLRVTTEFEGESESFVFDANTISTLIAEQEAKAEAKKKKFKYFELISITPI